MYLEALRDRCFRRAGRFRSQFTISTSDGYPVSFPLDRAYHQKPDHALMEFLDDVSDYELLSIDRGIAYNNGRVTWNPPKEAPWVVVDNLRTKRRTVYTVPGLAMFGFSARLAALGDQVLVVQLGRTLWVAQSG